MVSFYHPDPETHPQLEGEELKHCVRVLRKKSGDEVILLDGKGHRYQAVLREIRSQACDFEITTRQSLPQKPFSCHLAIAPTKNIDRMEWLVEKAAELAVDEISFVHTSRSERPRIKPDRLEKKAISALKQSGSGFKMRINPMVSLTQWMKECDEPQKFIAVVENGLPYFSEMLHAGTRVSVLVGPEGDFTPEEVVQATSLGFWKVSLGTTVLRTETAGLMACHFVNVANGF